MKNKPIKVEQAQAMVKEIRQQNRNVGCAFLFGITCGVGFMLVVIGISRLL